MQKWLETYLHSVSLRGYVTGSAQSKLNQRALSSIQIPLPGDQATLAKFICEFEAGGDLVDSNRELIVHLKWKSQDSIDRN